MIELGVMSDEDREFYVNFLVQDGCFSFNNNGPKFSISGSGRKRGKVVALWGIFGELGAISGVKEERREVKLVINGLENCVKLREMLLKYPKLRKRVDFMLWGEGVEKANEVPWGGKGWVYSEYKEFFRRLGVWRNKRFPWLGERPKFNEISDDVRRDIEYLTLEW